MALPLDNFLGEYQVKVHVHSVHLLVHMSKKSFVSSLFKGDLFMIRVSVKRYIINLSIIFDRLQDILIVNLL